jgi:hypothetical protein
MPYAAKARRHPFILLFVIDMKYSPLSISRRHVLGDLYARCEHLESVPVYLADVSTEPIGHCDESLGIYADAFCFHLSDDDCKKLSTGNFTFSFDYEASTAVDARSRQVTLRSIILNPRKAYEKPGPKSSQSVAVAEEAKV